MKTNKTKRAGRSKRRTLKRKQRGGMRKLIDGSVVEGEIHKGKVKGPGKRTFADGSVYEGPFDGFIPHGQGKLTMSDRQVYVGQFSNGGINGRGRMTDTDGNVTEGEFITVQGVALAHGVGKLTYAATGTVYEGLFMNGMFNGPGTLTMTDGSVFEGHFRNGVVDGVGRLTHADGMMFEGLFRHINGELVHLDMPLLELKPGTSDTTLENLYDVERAIAERPSGAS